MTSVYCIAIESESSGLSQWFAKEADRDAFALRAPVTPGDTVTEWVQEVPDGLSADEITELVDDVMWGQACAATQQYKVN